MPIGVGTNLDAKSGNVNVSLTNDAGNAMRVSCATASIPSAVSGYGVGCTLQDTTTGILYVNTGTTSSCTFTETGITQTGNKGYYIVETTTTGTTAVNVFGTTNGFAGTITGMYLIANDATAATITLNNSGGTVGTIAKGATSGVMLGSTSLSNTAFTAGGTMGVFSSVAGGIAGGQAQVFVTFTTT